MKKNILLILIIITTFFINTNVVNAGCDPLGYDKGCVYETSGTTEKVKLLYTDSETMIKWTSPYSDEDTDIRNINGVSEEKFVDYTSTATTDIFNNNISSTEIGSVCPKKIYKYEENHTTAWPSKEYYDYWVLEEGSMSNDGWGVSTKWTTFELVDVCEKNVFSPDSGDENTDCGDIISQDIRNIINEILTVIRIGVPILLVGLIIYDLSTAVFAGSDDKVKKARDRAIKRIIIAIVIFFVPTLINFVFDIVNEIWGTKIGSCGIN